MSGTGCSPRVLATICRWQFHESRRGECQASGDVVPGVREWVIAAAPNDPKEARGCMNAVVWLVLWTRSALGVEDPTTVFASETVDHWLLSGEHPYAGNSLRGVRSLVRKVGRSVLDQGSTPPVRLSSSPPSDHYSTADERWFREAAALQGYRNTDTRMWVVVAPLAAGLNGPETAAATVDDLIELDDGRLAIKVRGDNERTVPLRRDYTGLARTARAAARGSYFVTSAAANNA